jgi:hypothetical protein
MIHWAARVQLGIIRVLMEVLPTRICISTIVASQAARSSHPNVCTGYTNVEQRRF